MPKPAVSIPGALPTQLVVSDLIAGSGHAADAGDTVIGHYVGVLSADGREFDNSYDSGTPLEVTIGAGQVIPGFEQGLIGAQQGMRRQLDIPAALAYGDRPPSGGII
ncbi:MAG: FKBP-type peptidyl-prolyl cis-trans isomerase, partial [Actinobacteria bacterium]|nr:FKBP-type peptidyl-prolyl cis-trans isomerase [Actinomycetota bacterium]